MFKKRNIKQPTRRRNDEPEEAEENLDGATPTEDAAASEGEDKMTIEELMALRKLRKSRQGIDSTRLTEGDMKKRRRKQEGEEEESAPQYGLQKPKGGHDIVDDENDLDDAETKARKLVRANNFTQQTNKLDVDKHMMAYIEENMQKIRGGTPNSEDMSGEEPYDPHAELFKIDEKYQIKKQVVEEGNVTNSLAMLTAIPEVDLGMDVRLRNIEETEKAKRQVQDDKKQRRNNQRDDADAYLASTRFFRPHQSVPSDSEALKNARLEAMGLPTEQERRPHNERKDVATDDLVMERFKKRMRR